MAGGHGYDGNAHPTANSVSINRQYITYYIPAQVDVLRLMDIFGATYPLPTGDAVLASMEGASWWGSLLFYLSRGMYDESGKTTLFAYDPTTHSAQEHLLNFPESFSPQHFYLGWNYESGAVEVTLVGETRSNKYSRQW